MDDVANHDLGKFMFQNGSTDDIEGSFHFDTDGERDVMVFLHMQKTAGGQFCPEVIASLV